MADSWTKDRLVDDPLLHFQGDHPGEHGDQDHQKQQNLKLQIAVAHLSGELAVGGGFLGPHLVEASAGYVGEAKWFWGSGCHEFGLLMGIIKVRWRDDNDSNADRPPVPTKTGKSEGCAQTWRVAPKSDRNFGILAATPRVLVKNAAAGASRAPTGRFDSPKNAAPSAWARKSLNVGEVKVNGGGCLRLDSECICRKIKYNFY